MIVELDQLGRQIVLPAPPKRIISLVPSQTELLFDLGLDEEVVGITKFCVHPATQFRKKPRIGGTKDFHLDRIAALKPDLIIANKEENDRDLVAHLMQQYPVWVSDVRTLGDARAMIDGIGRLVGRAEPASLLSQSIQQAFYALPRSATPLRAAYFIWNAPLMVAGKDTFINEMLKWAGFENVFAGQVRYPSIRPEALQAAAPQVLLLSSEPFPFKEKHLQQFKQWLPDSVVKLADGELFSWYGSRLLQAPPYFINLQALIQNELEHEL
ncbi:MAG: ABC transporter substrate-binding protein [Phaeodactylibacter sp.]|nr:ABC transporter substrate-binding protein [Phaeodactylibacter sp.]